MTGKIDLKLLNILIADDSRLVCNSIAVILREVGFDSNKIICAYRPNDVINLSKNNEFDVIVCDFNFNSNLNGYQILDELRHQSLMQSHTFFSFLTGESEPKVVRSIIDSEPDDYILKPFNKQLLASRILSGIKRKLSLNSIYSLVVNQNYSEAVGKCDDILPFFPQYNRTIRLLKAKSLTALGKTELAIQEYRTLLDDQNCDHVKVKLANCLIENGDKDEARAVVRTLVNQDNNPYYHDEMAYIHIHNGELIKSINSLKKATQLMDAGAERELIISNLSLSVNNYSDAFIYIKRYSDKNENTYRDSDYITLNFVRCFLYRFTEGEPVNTFENQTSVIHSRMNLLERVNNIKFQVELIAIHMLFIRNELKQASLRLSKLIAPENAHFYDYYHFIYLLDKLGVFKNIQRTLLLAKESIRQEQVTHIRLSQEYMWSCFEAEYKEKQDKIKSIKESISHLGMENNKDPMKYIELYLELRNALPYSIKVNFALIKLISNEQINLSHSRELFNVMSECNRVILLQTSSDERNKLNYKEVYSKAKENLS